MNTAGEEQFSVHVEWVDPHSQLLRPFHLKFFQVDSTLEIYDTRQKRMFLKRVAPPEGTRATDLFKGNTVTIYSRKMRVTDYADERTRKFFEATRSTCVAIVTPRTVRRLGSVLEGVQEAGMDIAAMRMLRLSAAEAAALEKIGGRPSGADLTSGVVVALELVAADCWNIATLLGRGSSGLRITPTEAAVQGEIDYLFSNDRKSTASYRDCTVCIIRPYAVADGSAATIIKDIQAGGFSISALSTVEFSNTDASDLYDCYKGVVPQYKKWVAELASGPAIALELVGEDVAAQFRKFVGPYNPEIAAILRPKSLRAKHGESAERNAVHCTDLSNDGPLESKFIFHVVRNS